MEDPLRCRLREMAAGDVVFLPQRPTVQHPDAWDQAPVVDEAGVRQECRQVIGVAETMRYAYGAGTLDPDLFEVPRRRAIQHIAEDDPSYRALAAFLQRWSR